MYRALRATVVIGVVAAGACGAAAAPDQLSDTFHRWLDNPAIDYPAPAADPVAMLNGRLASGAARLDFVGPSGYLRSVLDALHVPVQSQVLVFAQDSVQARRISPTNPRALYFNDQVAVGWMPGGFIELAAEDPRHGVMFYTLDQAPVARPAFTRREDCLSCHYARSTVGVPGMLSRSAGHFEVDHRLPIDQRWGGWYVTGTTGAIRHEGNTDLDELFTASRRADHYNWPSLDGRVDMHAYLSADSDVAALLVFDHQMHGMNLLTRIGWEARVAAALPGPDDTVPLDAAAVEVVDYLLFVDEPPLPNPVAGSSGFAEAFAARGPVDRRGRSLRQLDLTTRLMRYPCSYLIYAPQFDALPAPAKAAIYRRLWAVLSGAVRGDRYSRLSREDRAAIVDILRDTKPDLPAYFHALS